MPLFDNQSPVRWQRFISYRENFNPKGVLMQKMSIRFGEDSIIGKNFVYLTIRCGADSDVVDGFGDISRELLLHFLL